MYQIQDTEYSSCSSIAVAEWVNGFELIMGHCHFQERIYRILDIVIQEFQQIRHLLLHYSFSSWWSVNGFSDQRTPAPLFDYHLRLVRANAIVSLFDRPVHIDYCTQGHSLV